ncbi:MAG: nucleotidyltransferase domain-containing protein [Candidatus Aenigmarchaeota archaeon]|nr:nucleotidyltransferase domain-containing protein [Candidatus Aenigmarchaeota archaeon]
MNEQSKRKSYAISFTSFLLRELKSTSRIKRVILFGSVARSESTKESDVDIFIDIEKETKKLKQGIEQVLERFYKSKEAILFKLLGTENTFNLVIGSLDKWKGLKRSILSDGIVLWGKLESREKPGETQHKIIFYWDSIKKNRGAFLNKIYGYRAVGKEYRGLLEQCKGERIGKSCVIIPIAYRDAMVKLLKKYKVDAKVVEVFT